MESSKPAVVINLDANGGKAKSKWESIRNEFSKYFDEELHLTTYTLPFDIERYLKGVIEKKQIRQLIIGGGDGTIHLFINELSRIVGLIGLKEYSIGAIGLGSSNDFFKPFSKRIANIPVRISTNQSELADLGLVKINRDNDDVITKLFVVNAGIGVIAEANHQYNNPDKIISLLKNKATQLSIIYTAIKTIVGFKNILLNLSYKDNYQSANVSNLSVTLMPYISGSFHYKTTKPRKGFLDLYICQDMSKMDLLLTLFNLAKGKFPIGNKRIVQQINSLKVTSRKSVPIETDGEITIGNTFDFSIKKDFIQLMN